MSLRLLSLLLLSIFVLGGCTKYFSKLDKVLPDRRKEYQQSQSLPDLEVPPDLSDEHIDDTLSVPNLNDDGTASFSTYQERVVQQQEARKYANVDEASAIADIAGEQLITVQATPKKAWGVLKKFWGNLGYDLDLNDQELGVMETHWKGDEDTQKRDKFKVFIEPAGEVGTSSVYLSHTGESFDESIWTERDRDLPLEKRMAVRIQSALGGVSPNTTSSALSTSSVVDNQVDSSAPLAELIGAGDGKMYLALQRDFDTSWPLISNALSNTNNITVEKSDKDTGTYSIVYRQAGEEEEGIMSKLAFWSDDSKEYQLSLTGIGQKTEVIILDEDGKWEDSKMATEILRQIKENL